MQSHLSPNPRFGGRLNALLAGLESEYAWYLPLVTSVQSIEDWLSRLVAALAGEAFKPLPLVTDVVVAYPIESRLYPRILLLPRRRSRGRSRSLESFNSRYICVLRKTVMSEEISATYKLLKLKPEVKQL